jgi:hypothetical protein
MNTRTKLRNRWPLAPSRSLTALCKIRLPGRPDWVASRAEFRKVPAGNELLCLERAFMNNAR